jgi:hypothetical protein
MRLKEQGAEVAVFRCEARDFPSQRIRAVRAIDGAVIHGRQGRIRLYYSQYFLRNELLHARGGEIAYAEARDGQANLRNQVVTGKHFPDVNALVLQKAPVHHPRSGGVALSEQRKVRDFCERNGHILGY